MLLVFKLFLSTTTVQIIIFVVCSFLKWKFFCCYFALKSFFMTFPFSFAYSLCSEKPSPCLQVWNSNLPLSVCKTNILPLNYCLSAKQWITLCLCLCVHVCKWGRDSNKSLSIRFLLCCAKRRAGRSERGDKYTCVCWNSHHWNSCGASLDPENYTHSWIW